MHRSIFSAALVVCTVIPGLALSQDTVPVLPNTTPVLPDTGFVVLPEQCVDRTVVSIANLQDPISDFSRVLEIAGEARTQSRLIQRPGSAALVRDCPDPFVPDPWTSRFGRPHGAEGSSGIDLLPLRLHVVNNSGYPGGRNDGALWAGRGLSLEGRGGVEGRWGAISAAVYPSIAYQQNRDFVLAETGQTAATRTGTPGIPESICRSVSAPIRSGRWIRVRATCGPICSTPRRESPPRISGGGRGSGTPS
jgi:hypothetical protein